VKEKLNRLRARRRGHRRVCTKLEKEATELLQIPDGEGDHIERSEVIAVQLQEIIKRNRRRNIGHLRRE
jgi:flagellar biosynthesis/type III secretory pathway chaperone